MEISGDQWRLVALPGKLRTLNPINPTCPLIGQVLLFHLSSIRNKWGPTISEICQYKSTIKTGSPTFQTVIQMEKVEWPTGSL